MGTQWRVVIGSDSAGLQYKDALLEDLKKNPNVSSVVDLGVIARTKKRTGIIQKLFRRREKHGS